MDYALKRLSEDSVDKALAKAEQYRALNEPEEAESICRDVLAVTPSHAPALRTLGLALTDQFPDGGWQRLFDSAVDAFGQLGSAYERAYYSGIAWERCAKAQLAQSQAHNALHSFEQALAHFEQAEQLAPASNPDPLLRWNSCVRAMRGEDALEAARVEPRTSEIELGD